MCWCDCLTPIVDAAGGGKNDKKPGSAGSAASKRKRRTSAEIVASAGNDSESERRGSVSSLEGSKKKTRKGEGEKDSEIETVDIGGYPLRKGRKTSDFEKPVQVSALLEDSDDDSAEPRQDNDDEASEDKGGNESEVDELDEQNEEDEDEDEEDNVAVVELAAKKGKPKKSKKEKVKKPVKMSAAEVEARSMARKAVQRLELEKAAGVAHGVSKGAEPGSSAVEAKAGSGDESDEPSDDEKDQSYEPGKSEREAARKKDRAERSRRKTAEEMSTEKAEKAVLDSLETLVEDKKFQFVRGVRNSKPNGSGDDVEIPMTRKELEAAKVASLDSKALEKHFRATAKAMREGIRQDPTERYFRQHGFALIEQHKEAFNGDEGMERLIKGFILRWDLVVEKILPGGAALDSQAELEEEMKVRDLMDKEGVILNDKYMLYLFQGTKKSNAEVVADFEKCLAWAKEEVPDWASYGDGAFEAKVRKFFQDAHMFGQRGEQCKFVPWFSLELSQMGEGSGVGCFLSHTAHRGDLLMTYMGRSFLDHLSKKHNRRLKMPKWCEHPDHSLVKKALPEHHRDYFMEVRKLDGSIECVSASGIAMKGSGLGRGSLYGGAHMLNSTGKTSAGRNVFVDAFGCLWCIRSTLAPGTELKFQYQQKKKKQKSQSKASGKTNKSNRTSPRPAKGPQSGASVSSGEKKVARLHIGTEVKEVDVSSKNLWGPVCFNVAKSAWGDSIESCSVVLMKAGSPDDASEHLALGDKVIESEVVDATLEVHSSASHLVGTGGPILLLIGCSFGAPSGSFGMIVDRDNRVADILLASFPLLTSHFDLDASADQHVLVEKSLSDEDMEKDWDNLCSRTLKSYEPTKPFVTLELKMSVEGGDWEAFEDAMS